MPKIILSTTPSFTQTIESSSLRSTVEEKGFNVVMTDMHPPFSFDTNEVFAIVAGEQKLGKEEFNQFPNLTIIARFGRGLDTIDVVSAKEKGIKVTTVSHGSNTAVAELAIGFVFALARRIITFDGQIKKGEWQRDYGNGIVGKNIGIVGFGVIGKEVAKMAKGIGMNVLVCAPSISKDVKREYPEVSCRDFKTLLQESDFVSLHVPLKAETRNLIDASALAFMRPSAFLINTSRGAVVDETALLSALDQGIISGAGLDVFVNEPVFAEDGISKKLALHPRVIATPHIASFTPEAHGEIAKIVLKNIFAVYEGTLNNLEGEVII